MAEKNYLYTKQRLGNYGWIMRVLKCEVRKALDVIPHITKHISEILLIFFLSFSQALKIWRMWKHRKDVGNIFLIALSPPRVLMLLIIELLVSNDLWWYTVHDDPVPDTDGNAASLAPRNLIFSRKTKHKKSIHTWLIKISCTKPRLGEWDWEICSITLTFWEFWENIIIDFFAVSLQADDKCENINFVIKWLFFASWKVDIQIAQILKECGKMVENSRVKMFTKIHNVLFQL